MKFFKKPIVIAIIVLVAISGGYFYFSSGKKVAPEYVEVKIGNIIQEVSVTGNVKPVTSVDLAFEKSGKIAEAPISVGDYVSAGQIIAQEDNSELLSQLDKAEADLTTQRAELDKQKIVLANNYSSVPNILNDGYTKADDAVRNKVDAMFTNGETDTVRAASNDPRTPLLNRAVAGLYTPGSIVKPIFAIAAVNEGIISPDKKIESKGALILPNPFNPDQPSIFRDWTVHGWVNMREAIAVSSDEYFYTIGGGFGTQKGLGIIKMDEYAKKFGLAEPTGIDLGGEETGLIPTPECKERVFGVNDPWRIGDTYHTVIGQFGFQITALQAVRYTAAIANGGKLMKPQLVASSTPEYREVGISDEYVQIAREGMRMAVESDLRTATVKALHIGGIKISAKTGTAQLGFRNESMNSWSIGFWPADDPKYAYAVVLEKAPAGTASGAAPGLVPFFQWLIAEKPEYVK